MATHERLRAWQLCHKLALCVYRTTDRWPKSERYELTSQARRAAHSAAANIAEGWARQGPRELCRYLNIALGSLAELDYTFRLAVDLQIIDDSEWQAIRELRSAAEAITRRFYKSVRKSRLAQQ
jgi:four helix bundle protein